MPGEFRKTEVFENHIVITYTVDDSHEGWRADQYLKDLYWRKSRNQLQKAIDAGLITMPNKRLKASTNLLRGDTISVITPKRGEEPEVNPDFKVLYEDEHLMVIDKPGNLPVHPAGRYLFGNLLTILRNQRPDWIAEDRNFYLIHRLDRETSGVLILGKQKPVAKNLTDQFFDRTTEKRYFAIVDGHPEADAFTVDADIGPAGSEIRLKMAAYPAGTGASLPESGIQHALTHFKVLQRTRRYSLVECKLETGRQHQIRVHLHHAGFPVLGDKLYGVNEAAFLEFMNNNREMTESLREQFKIERHALHSRSLKFFHQPLNKWMQIESPLPQDMQEVLDADRT